MSPSISVSSKQGYFSRIFSSFVGVLFGIAMFFGSFAVLYMNEGRVDISKIAAEAVEVSEDGSVGSAVEDGALVYTRGTVATESLIGDGLYLNAGDYLVVERVVEMYAWVEEETTTTTKHTGGSQTTETTYTYDMIWTQMPESSSSFYDSSYYNPSKAVDDWTVKADDVFVGVYELDFNSLDLPALSALGLNEEMLTLEEDVILSGNTVYVGEGGISMPEVGDLRITYEVLKNNMDATVFGELSGDSLLSYMDDNGETSLYRMFMGSFDDAIVTMHGEYKMALWGMRVLGFLLMFFGLMLITGPVSTVLDVLPFLGSASRFIIGIVAFLIAAILSTVTVFVSMVLHNVFALIFAVLATIGVVVFVMNKKKDVIADKVKQVEGKVKGKGAAKSLGKSGSKGSSKNK